MPSPLRSYPVIRDLITDVSADYRKAHTISSFTQTGDPAPGDYRMTQVDIGRSQEFRTCIECWLCQDVCHLIRDHKDNKPTYSEPRSSSATPGWTCIHWARWTAT